MIRRLVIAAAVLNRVTEGVFGMTLVLVLECREVETDSKKINDLNSIHKAYQIISS